VWPGTRRAWVQQAPCKRPRHSAWLQEAPCRPHRKRDTHPERLRLADVEDRLQRRHKHRPRHEAAQPRRHMLQQDAVIRHGSCALGRAAGAADGGGCPQGGARDANTARAATLGHTGRTAGNRGRRHGSIFPPRRSPRALVADGSRGPAEMHSAPGSSRKGCNRRETASKRAQGVAELNWTDCRQADRRGRAYEITGLIAGTHWRRCAGV
jgi:hypothetical protein